jgi:hypothetical protein
MMARRKKRGRRKRRRGVEDMGKSCIAGVGWCMGEKGMRS